jgi:hypothetical protein
MFAYVLVLSVDMDKNESCLLVASDINIICDVIVYRCASGITTGCCLQPVGYGPRLALVWVLVCFHVL